MRRGSQPPQLVFEHACRAERHANDAVDSSGQRTLTGVSAAGRVVVASGGVLCIAHPALQSGASGQPPATCQSQCSERHHAAAAPAHAAVRGPQPRRWRHSARHLDPAAAVTATVSNPRHRRHLAIRGGGGSTQAGTQPTASERMASVSARFTSITGIQVCHLLMAVGPALCWFWVHQILRHGGCEHTQDIHGNSAETATPLADVLD